MQSLCVMSSLLLLLNFLHSNCLKQPLATNNKPFSGVTLNAFKRGPYTSNVKAPSSGIDGRSVKDGSIIEYLSAKGSKRLAIVNKRKGPELEVLNNALMEFSVSVSKVTYLIEGLYSFDDLVNLNNALGDQKLEQVEGLWNSVTEGADTPVTIELVSQNVFGSTNKVDMYLSMKLMAQFGRTFFKESIPAKNDLATTGVVYVPLPSETVHANLKHRSDLQEFRSEFIRMMTSQAPRSGRSSEIQVMDAKVSSALNEYTDGLKQLIAKSHPWVVNGWCTKSFDENAVAKGKELLDYMELSPVSKSARKVLEITGVWPVHTNVDKYVMGIREVFPSKVIEEADFILKNSDIIVDPDELQRKDLTHLNCYAIDSEGAAEVGYLWLFILFIFMLDVLIVYICNKLTVISFIELSKPSLVLYADMTGVRYIVFQRFIYSIHFRNTDRSSSSLLFFSSSFSPFLLFLLLLFCSSSSSSFAPTVCSSPLHLYLYSFLSSPSFTLSLPSSYPRAWYSFPPS